MKLKKKLSLKRNAQKIKNKWEVDGLTCLNKTSSISSWLSSVKKESNLTSVYQQIKVGKVYTE